MSDYKDWERESPVVVEDVERWDGTKSQLRDIVFNLNDGSNPDTKRIVDEKLFNHKVIHSFKYTNGGTSPSKTQSIPNSTVEMFFREGLYDAGSKSKGFLPKEVEPKGTYTSFSFKINLLEVCKEINPNMFSGLSKKEQRELVLLIAPQLKFQSSSKQVIEGNSGFVNVYSNTLVKVHEIKDSEGNFLYKTLPEALEYVYSHIRDFLDDDCNITFVDERFYTNTSILNAPTTVVADVFLTLEYLWMKKSESYTRNQLNEVLINLINGGNVSVNIEDKAYAPNKINKSVGEYKELNYSCLTIMEDIRETDYFPKDIPTLLKGIHYLPVHSFMTYQQPKLLSRPRFPVFSANKGSLNISKQSSKVVIEVDLVALAEKELKNIFKGDRRTKIETLRKLDLTFKANLDTGEWFTRPYSVPTNANPKGRAYLGYVVLNQWNQKENKFKELKRVKRKGFNYKKESNGNIYAFPSDPYSLSAFLTLPIEEIMTDDGYAYFTYHIEGLKENPDMSNQDNPLVDTSTWETNYTEFGKISTNPLETNFYFDMTVSANMLDIYETLKGSDSKYKELDERLKKLEG